MWNFLKKDMTVLKRERTELMILILMPFILIAILGFALRGIWSEEGEALNMTIAIVPEDHEQEGNDMFQADIEQLELSEQEKAMIDSTASEIMPVTMFRDIFQSDELKGMIETVDMSEKEANEALRKDEIEAIITIPTDFTYQMLQKMFLGRGEGSELQLKVQEKESFYTRIVENIMESFTQSFNFQTAVAVVTQGSLNVDHSSSLETLGGTTTISTTDKPITAMQYYTIGMSVMFVLYAASTIASYAYVEKKQHVLNRIILSGKSPIMYISSKFISGISIVMLQLIILFTLSTVLFQTFEQLTLRFWLGIALISFILACAVGALSALLTSIAVRLDSDHINGLFAGGITTVFAFLGGSFFPTDQLPTFIGEIGEWTPNGAALSAYIQWMQGTGLSNLMPIFLKLVVMAGCLFICSLIIFPKRRRIA